MKFIGITFLTLHVHQLAIACEERHNKEKFNFKTKRERKTFRIV